MYFTLSYTAVSASSAIHLTCELNRQPQGQVDLIAIWTLTDYPGLLEAMDRYQAHVQLKNDGVTPSRWIIDQTIYPNVCALLIMIIVIQINN